ncbi:MAG: RagB/SusD family nutrient uptake outer membrane protein [Bacteroidota bacterium]
MKKLLYTLIIVSAALSSCEKVLDQEPQTEVSDNGVISDKKTSLSALYGIYNNLQSGYVSTTNAFNLAGDNIISFANPTILVRDRSIDDDGGAPFSSYYVTINRANFIIKRVLGVVDAQFTEKERNQIVGEAYFLRALSYFDLARFYGGVQIVTEPSERIDTHAGTKRSTLAETYAQVLSDLNKAEQLVTDVADRSRINLYAVYALKARYYLYNEAWALAEEFATKSISNTATFELVKPFTAFYTGRLTKESIFELIYTADDPTTYWRSWLSTKDDGGNQTYTTSPSILTALLNPAQGGSRKNIVKAATSPVGFYAVQLYGKKDGTGSLFILRIAEQYLIRAEARAKKPSADLTGAASDLRAIQTRAEVTPLFELKPATTAADVILAIENERRLELAFEGHRFSDIVRTKRAAEVFGVVNPKLKESYQWVFPIPQGSIDKDPGLIQNPLY